MWNLLKKMMTLVTEFGISLDDLLQIVEDIISLPSPPDVGDQADFREWVGQVLTTFKNIAEKTKTPIDDSVIRMVTNTIDNDALWTLFYKLLRKVFNRDSNLRKVAATSYDSVAYTQDEMKVARDIMAACDTGVMNEDELMDKVDRQYGAVDPSSVVTIAVLLYELYQYLTSRKADEVTEAKTPTLESGPKD